MWRPSGVLPETIATQQWPILKGLYDTKNDLSAGVRVEMSDQIYLLSMPSVDGESLFLRGDWKRRELPHITRLLYKAKIFATRDEARDYVLSGPPNNWKILPIDTKRMFISRLKHE